MINTRWLSWLELATNMEWWNVIVNSGVMIGGVKVDSLFFYREREESNDRDEEEAAAPEYAAAEYAVLPSAWEVNSGAAAGWDTAAAAAPAGWEPAEHSGNRSFLGRSLHSRS